MAYVIFDLEFNQAYEDNNQSKNTKCPFEIIQIGAIKLDTNYDEIDSFNALVKPTLYPTIHPFIEKLTHITSDRLKVAQTFDKVFNDFCEFLGANDNILGVWGIVDIRELFRNVAYHQLDQKCIPKGYINIQPIASKILMVPNMSNIALRSAVELLDIPLTLDFHDAYHDAYYTAQVLKKLKAKSLQIQLYDPKSFQHDKNKRHRSVRSKVDYQALIKQFEKMYDRQMSSQEMDMITLAYKMGATHQFLQSNNENVKKNLYK